MKPPRVHSPAVLLEHGTVASIKKAKERQAEYERFFWDQHFELQYQRDKIKEQISDALNTALYKQFPVSALATLCEISLRPASIVRHR